MLKHLKKEKLLVILGPTATGKTDLALYLAKKFNGELVSCDSRQVYKKLDIGTGKSPAGKWKVESGEWRKENGFWEIEGIRIWMYDVVSPKKQYTVADYIKDSNKVIMDIIKRGKLPIIVGGTGLYLRALLEGLSNLAVPINQKLRRNLEKLTLIQLQQKLKTLSPTKWQNLNQSDRSNPRRLLRAIELAFMNPYDITSDKRKVASDKWNTLKIGLTAPREILYKRSDLRVISWFENGILTEVKSLLNSGLSSKRLKELGLEYKLIAEYLESNDSKHGDLIYRIQLNIHGYIRRQQTWFKKESNVEWFDITKAEYIDNVERQVDKWYYQDND